MLMNLIIGLPIMLLCLALQVAVRSWSIRFYMDNPAGSDPVTHRSRNSDIHDLIGHPQL